MTSGKKKLYKDRPRMMHIGKNTRSTIISKGISAGNSKGSYRGLVKMGAKADGARNYSQCECYFS